MVSIIIPVYNAQPYLAAMLDSVIAQADVGIELLLVNDGSTDESGAICREYAQRYAFVQAFDRENGGASAARNFGLSQAKGEFIWLMDSDDRLSPEALRTALSVQRQQDADIVIGGMNFYHVADGTVNPRAIERPLFLTKDTFAGHYRELFRHNYISSMCNKLIRRSLIEEHGVRLQDDLLMYEDYTFCMELLTHAQRIACVPDVFYEYLLRSSGSLSHRYKPNISRMFAILFEHISGYRMRLGAQSGDCVAALDNLIVYLAFECVRNEYRSPEKAYRHMRMLLNDATFIKAMGACRGSNLRYRVVHGMMKCRMTAALWVYLRLMAHK